MSALPQTVNNSALAAVPAHKTSGEAAFELAYRQAKALSSASLVPKEYRDNIPNTMIALAYANRIKADPFQVMQNLHIINGRPSLSSSFLIATVNACGRFTPLRFEVVGDDPTATDYKVRAYATDRESGDVCYGTWITWKMVKAEGWDGKSGSKWKSIPGQMFLYRGAAFWTRVYAPEYSQGILTEDEAFDIGALHGHAAPQVTAPTDTSSLGTLEAELTGQVIDTRTGEILSAENASFEDVQFAIRNAASIQELDAAAALIESLPEGDAAELDEEHRARRVALTSE